MRMRLGLVVGFGVGYYYGAKAGRERYLQLNQWLREVKRSDSVDLVSEKARAVVDLTVERARDLVDSRFNNDDEFVPNEPSAFSPS